MNENKLNGSDERLKKSAAASTRGDRVEARWPGQLLGQPAGSERRHPARKAHSAAHSAGKVPDLHVRAAERRHVPAPFPALADRPQRQQLQATRRGPPPVYRHRLGALCVDRGLGHQRPDHDPAPSGSQPQCRAAVPGPEARRAGAGWLSDRRHPGSDHVFTRQSVSLPGHDVH